jgi:hypothetical protein
MRSRCLNARATRGCSEIEQNDVEADSVIEENSAENALICRVIP